MIHEDLHKVSSRGILIGAPLAVKSILIYTVVAALFRDAKLADLIEQSPCILDERQLGPFVDKDPEWRNEAVFARDEVETILSDARTPADRQIDEIPFTKSHEIRIGVFGLR